MERESTENTTVPPVKTVSKILRRTKKTRCKRRNRNTEVEYSTNAICAGK